MAWTNPSSPNVMDFWSFCYQNGIPESSIPQPKFTITSGGSGYTTAPDVTIDPPTVGVTMTATALIASGSVSALTLTNPGTNYASAPNVTIASSTGGTTATATVALGSVWPASVLNQSMDRTIDDNAGAAIQGELTSYTKACYNLGFHLMLLLAQDGAGQSFFKNIRSTYELTQFRPGIMLASGDQATSQTYIVPKFFHELTLEALEATKTPWGRQWIEYQMMYSGTIWGMS